MYRCLNPDCNDATFDIDATCCAHCGHPELRAEHPGGVLDGQRRTFICGDCGGEYSAKVAGVDLSRIPIDALDALIA